jgi:NADPH-dependent ferric siderophore reductase
MRTYTVREHRKDVGELDIDFAVHGPGGSPATRWAARASEGSRVALLGPVVEDNGGVDFQPPRDADWVLLTADETATARGRGDPVVAASGYAGSGVG